jgi:hypothetical protein
MGMVVGGRRRELAYLAELLGITAVAVAQPVFNIVQAAPEELVARRARPAEIVAFALIVVLAPPLVLWLVEQPFRLARPPWRDRVHAGILGFGIALFAVELVKSILGREAQPWLALVGAVLAVGAAVLVFRTPRPGQILRYLALAAPAFLLLFLFASPVQDLVVAGGVDAAEVEVENPVPIVFIAFDELPLVSLLDGQGDIDARQYPAFAELAGDSTWFRNTTGVSPLTPSAMPAMLTGELPEELFPAPVATNFPENLFTLLGGTYDIEATEHLTELCPPAICQSERSTSSPRVLRSLLRTGADVFGSVASPWVDQRSLEFVIDREPTDPQAAVRLHEFAESLTPRDRPTFHFLHVLLPHQPWEWLASGATYDAPDPPRSSEFGNWHDQTTADEGRQRHLLQLQYTDQLLGRALDRMQESGLYDDALVVVAADHGIGFVGGEPLRAVSERNYHEVMWTPLLIKEPGQDEAAVDDRPVETIDIAPTVAEVVGAEAPWEADGESVFSADEDRPARMIDWRFHTVEPEGDFVVLDREEGFERVLAGSNPAAGDASPDAMLRLGPFGDLVGQPVSDGTLGPAADVEAMVDIPDSFTVPPAANQLPAYVQAAWSGPDQGWMAVAVDGRVAGLGLTYPQGPFHTFWAMLAERLLTTGEHDVALFALTGTAADPVYHPVAMSFGPVGQ